MPNNMKINNNTGFGAIILMLVMISGCGRPEEVDEKLSILILTGRNNHDWERTTALLDSTLKASGLFTVNITTRPETLRYEYLENYDALLMNWNSWPENNIRWPAAAEQGMLKFVDEGGGLVYFHSAASAFYDWPEFKHISTGSWILDSTWHGPVSRVKVTLRDRGHPVTKGLADFFIKDELWIDAAHNRSFEVLAVAENTEEDSGEQPAILVRDDGKSRIFFTILGHDETVLRNPEFQSLILRGVEWASTGQVIGSGHP
jgi:type 1 glutamine amidotransferase